MKKKTLGNCSLVQVECEKINKVKKIIINQSVLSFMKVKLGHELVGKMLMVMSSYFSITC